MSIPDRLRIFFRDQPQVPSARTYGVPSMRDIESRLAEPLDYITRKDPQTWSIGLANRNSTFEATYRESDAGGTFLGTEIAEVAEWPTGPTADRHRSRFNERLLRLDEDDYGRVKFDRSEPPRIQLERRFDRRYLSQEGIVNELNAFNIAQEGTWNAVRKIADDEGIRLKRSD